MNKNYIFGSNGGNKKIRESNLWRWLSIVRKEDDIHIQRIENLIGRSTPDVELVIGKTQCWIELKTTLRPKKESSKIRIKFQDGQSSWLKKRYLLNKGAFLLVQIGSGHGASRYLIPGDDVPEVEKGITESEINLLSICNKKDGPYEILSAIKVNDYEDFE